MIHRSTVALALFLAVTACDRGASSIAHSGAPSTSADDQPGRPAAMLSARAMVKIPDGQLRLGADKRGAPGIVTPVKSFWMDRMEVTVRDYERCTVAGRCTPPHNDWPTCNWRRAGRSDHPINCVDWSQATTYCTWAGKRLPSEPEWEFAARGADGRLYPWGDAFADGAACVNRRSTADEGTCPVARFSTDASPFGVVGMAGNVKEWTSGMEMLPGKVQARVLRGSDWSTESLSVVPPGRVIERESLRPSEFAADLGFRCAADRPPTGEAPGSDPP